MWLTPEPAPSSAVRVSVGEAYQPFWIDGLSVAVVTGGVVSWTIVMSELLTSKSTFTIASTLIRPCVVPVFGSVTDCEPSFGVDAASTVGKVCPPSVDRLIFTFAVLIPLASVPATFHVTGSCPAPLTEDGLEVTRNGPVPAASVSTASSELVPPRPSRTVKRMSSRGGAALFAAAAPVYDEVGRKSIKHSLTGIGTGGAIGPWVQAPVSALVLLARMFRISGNTRVGLFVRWFSFGEL